MLLLDEPFAALDAITRQQVRNELADVLSELRLPTLLVTHAFGDVVALAQRIGVLDHGELIQLGAPDELFDRPATALVAELTGANVLRGEATPSAGGSLIALEGGGRLASVMPASGPVIVAIQPWELELTDPESGTLADLIVSVHRDHAGVVVRCTRVTVQLTSDGNAQPPPSEGAPIGLRASPTHVRVLAAG